MFIKLGFEKIIMKYNSATVLGYANFYVSLIKFRNITDICKNICNFKYPT